MSEENKKKTSFVKEEEKGEVAGRRMPTDSELLVLSLEQLYNINLKLDQLIRIFSEAKEKIKEEEPQPVEVAPSIPKPVQNPPSPAVEKIVKAFEPYKDLVELDLEESEQFVIVRPKGFLGNENFSKIASLSKSLNGVYVSQGRKSHFKIPKLESGKSNQKKTSQKTIQSPSPSKENKAFPFDLFPEDLASMLKIVEEKDKYVIKTRQFLGAENFAKIASIIRDAGGKYISAGKDSHFEIPKKK